MMTSSLGQITPDSAPAVSPALWDLLKVGGVTILLGVIIFIVAFVVRSRPRHRHRSRHGPEILKNTEEHLRDAEDREESRDAGHSPQRHRRKRRRREHRPRNPTLADVGGLPPKRDSDAPPHSGL
jgi:hypothetical protein